MGVCSGWSLPLGRDYYKNNGAPMTKGSIQPGIASGQVEVCPACGSKFTHNIIHQDGTKTKLERPFCPNHPTIFPSRYRVMFGKICQHHKSYETAIMSLNGLRHEHNSGRLDEREYQFKLKPLSFQRLVDEWLNIKSLQGLTPKTLRSMTASIAYAQKEWGDTSINDITPAMMQKFILSRDCASKTKAHMLYNLKQFWKWAEDSYDIKSFKKWPEIGAVHMELKKTVSLVMQQRVLDDIRDHEPFRVTLGMVWQARYLIRPRELRDITESCVDRERGLIFLLKPKGGKPETIKMAPIDIELVRALPMSEDPNLPFFRHEGGVAGAPVGEKFGEHQFRRACYRAYERLGIKPGDPEYVPPYALLKHSTMTAWAQEGFTLGAIMQLSRHKTPTVAMRYAHIPDADYTARDTVLAKQLSKIENSQADNGLTMENAETIKGNSAILH